MVLSLIPGVLAVLSLCLLLWQWLAARRFPLHRRLPPASTTGPAVTLLKPLTGTDEATEQCLRSWLEQSWSGPVQVLFGVSSADDPVRAVVRNLLGSRPGLDAELVITGPPASPNAKVCQLARLLPQAKHDLVIISDADVQVPPDLLANLVPLLSDSSVGLAHCFYRLANPSTPAMQWEAVAINADFWSQVLQSESLRPTHFALGAVMATRKQRIAEMGGFEALADCLADDYQLGHRIARRGWRIVTCPVVVECWSEPMNWAAVWKHQLRWARTIRVCQPAPYFFSILSNATLWPLVWLAVQPSLLTLGSFIAACALRISMALDLQRRLSPAQASPCHFWMALVKDLLQVVIWAAAFLGSTIEWRGRRFRVGLDGRVQRGTGTSPTKPPL